MNVIQQCQTQCRAAPQKVVFADALDPRVLDAAGVLKREGLAEPILIGNPLALRDCAGRAGMALPGLTVIDPLHCDNFESFAEAYLALDNSGLDSEGARQSLSNPLFYAAMLVRSGQADICIAGNLSTTGAVLRAALKVIGVAEQHETVSSFFMMSSPDGKDVRLFADAGVVPEPTVAQLADITIDAARNYAKLTGDVPRVAMLSFSTKGSSDHPAARRVREAFEQVRAKAPDLIVDGELQFDAAVVPAVAQQKSPDSPLHGNSNVMIFPSLNAGNIAYKVAQRLCHYQALGPLLQGLMRPMHDLSRGCSADDIVNIAVLASCLNRP
ncbi:phosphate acetyltransferase [Exilibacterium tricleocarpae]|uniref:Phosphate acetyltransferase n=1 Tax=Exilibacterium tricleocarpae TaxID=2591008 RepID=A0A545TV75_9GAMM|nr:phosphate acetyltransferase [Exilibacterium tricleocarpae]TQV81118.1 phosphate acetyltransferase [Exilibacterium tricleocarpae]